MELDRAADDRQPNRIVVTDTLDRRVTLRLLNYWVSLRRSAGGPFFADFKWFRNPVPWPDCRLVFVGADGGVVVEHSGEALRQIFDLVDAPSPEEVDIGKHAGLFGDIRATLADGRPAIREGAYARSDGSVLYRSILLPFVDVAGRPAYILHAVSYKAVRP